MYLLLFFSVYGAYNSFITIFSWSLRILIIEK
jgi:hypothetical protein